MWINSSTQESKTLPLCSSNLHNRRRRVIACFSLFQFNNSLNVRATRVQQPSNKWTEPLWHLHLLICKRPLNDSSHTLNKYDQNSIYHHTLSIVAIYSFPCPASNFAHCFHILTVYLACSICMNPRAGPEYKNFAVVLTVHELWILFVARSL